MPQVCLLFGPSAAGGAYIPAFCDVVIMREGNASMYSACRGWRIWRIGERVTLEEMGGAKMYTGVSGCGHFLVKTDADDRRRQAVFRLALPANWREQAPAALPWPSPPASAPGSRSCLPTRRRRSTSRS